MSILYPRLPLASADVLFAEADTLAPALEHKAQIFAAVGGHRAKPADVETIARGVRDLAGQFGFPDPMAVADRIVFDRRTAELLVGSMRLSWSEAAAPEIWSFLALVALPDVTRWRFGVSNRERWIGSDLTRHTWARAWWRGTVFAKRPDLLDSLTESDLNQILERRVIGGDPRLVTGLAQALLEAEANSPVQRRTLIRDCAARLRRRLAFVDARALDDEEVDDLCRSITNESTGHLPADSASSDEPDDDMAAES